MQVKVKKLNENAVIPKYAHFGTDMGADITCIGVEYDAEKDRFIYHTGLAFEVPQGYGMLIFPRSSNTKTEAYLPNSVGILDSSYRGELMFIYKLRDNLRSTINMFDSKYREEYLMNNYAPYKVGDRIGQIVIIPYPIIEYIESEELSDTERGTGGFGSTGK